MRPSDASRKNVASMVHLNTFLGMLNLRLLWLCLGVAILVAGCAHPGGAPLGTRVDTTPKLEILNQQIKNNPKDAQAFSNRGYTFALLGRAPEARADLQKALELKSTGPMHNRVGWAYFNLGDYAVAAKEFEFAAKLSNNRSHYDYYSLVLGYWGTGDTKKALENYQLAVERDPKFGEYKTLNERTAEWTALERRAIHETYVLWSKAWKP
jgi:tetratricopeptide (TPR) repeat protein